MQVTASRSPAATARRAQIVAATVEVLASDGYRGTSFVRIAARAGLSSTRLISYHFASKDELIAAVAEQVVTSMASQVTQRVRAAPDARGRLAAYIEGVAEFNATQRAPMRALMEIFLAGGMDYSPAHDVAVTGPIAAILHDGQARGEFREFDTRTVATIVQRAVEGLPFLLAADPDLDIDGYARELLAVLDHGISAGTP